MTNFEDHVAQALREVPTNGQHPLESIERRARAIRYRRRAVGGAAAGLAAAVIAVPSLTSLDANIDLGPAAPSTTSTEPGCASAPEGSAPALAIAEVPDELRQLWSDTAGPSPAGAEGYDYAATAEQHPNTCTAHAHLRLVEVDEDSVTRVVTISALPPSEPTDAPGRRIIDTGDVDVSIDRRWTAQMGAWWAGDDVTWQLEAEGAMTDSEVAELAAAVEFVDGVIRVDEWSGAADAYQVFVEELTLSEEIGRSFRAHATGIQLIVEERVPDDVWYRASAGARITAINGSTALVSTDDSGETTVRWSPAAGIAATLRSTDAEVEADAVIEIAKSVRRVPADDELLTAVWRDKADE